MTHWLRFERLPGNGLPLPKYASEYAAGLDLAACLSRPCAFADRQESFMTGDHPARRRGIAMNLDQYLHDNQQRIPPLYISGGEIILVPTGWKIEFPPNSVLKIYIRSSVSLKGLCLVNHVGIIDSDYRGEILLAIKNDSQNVLAIAHGDRLAQAILEPCPRPVITAGNTSETKRGAGGLGSTGTTALDELELDVKPVAAAVGPPQGSTPAAD